ncbi:response regulator transcription factor [Spongiimicrobium salis]|uniref:response regulator transcription factor n=1 Tax=Spongiimicrobium salis TaxID=1667022 RepID=UPI00374CB920
MRDKNTPFTQKNTRIIQYGGGEKESFLFLSKENSKPQMESVEKYDFLTSFTSNGSERSCSSKLSKIFEVCDFSKHLMVGIYVIEKKQFLYFNRSFKRNLGHYSARLLDEGWDFWFSRICPTELEGVRLKLLPLLHPDASGSSIPLNYHIINASNTILSVRHELMRYMLGDHTLIINYFLDTTDKERIEHCLNGSQGQGFPKETHLQTKMISPREEEVLKLIAEGYSSKEIADQLFISNHTAISHRKHLIEKFKVKNTAQLIKKASKVMEL